LSCDLFQVRPAHHIVSARQAYAHLPCVLRPGYPLPPRPSETLQRSPDADAPPPRPRRHRVHSSARHPRPLDPGPRMPPSQRRRLPARHRTVPRPRAWDARASTVIGATAARPARRNPAGENDQRPRSRPPRPRTARICDGVRGEQQLTAGACLHSGSAPPPAQAGPRSRARTRSPGARSLPPRSSRVWTRRSR